MGSSGRRDWPKSPEPPRDQGETSDEQDQTRLGADEEKLGLLNENRELIRFPLYGGVATILLAIVFLGPGLYLLDKDSLGGAIPLIVIGIYVLSVVGFYFSVGLAAAADMIFRGQPRHGRRRPRRRPQPLQPDLRLGGDLDRDQRASWAPLENQGGIGGEIAARLVGTAWSLVTFLAVPVIAIEGTGPLQTLKRSASMFKQRWGQQITGNIVIGGVIFLARRAAGRGPGRRRSRCFGPRLPSAAPCWS